MKELVGIAVLIAGLFGGTFLAKRILKEARDAALTKAAQGLPGLSPFAAQLTKAPSKKDSQQKRGNDVIKK